MAGRQRSFNDKDVINLLSRLKTSGVEYPANLQVQRRAAFMASVVALASGTGFGPGTSSGGGSAAGGAGGPGTAAFGGLSQVDKLIVGIEIIVLTGLTTVLAVAAYDNRDYLKHLLLPNTPTVAVQNIPNYLTLVVPTNPVYPTMTGVPTGTGTPQLGVSNNNNSSNSQPGATPEPGQGNHYGQTQNPPNPQPKAPSGQ